MNIAARKNSIFYICTTTIYRSSRQFHLRFFAVTISLMHREHALPVLHNSLRHAKAIAPALHSAQHSPHIHQHRHHLSSLSPSLIIIITSPEPHNLRPISSPHPTLSAPFRPSTHYFPCAIHAPSRHRITPYQLCIWASAPTLSTHSMYIGNTVQRAWGGRLGAAMYACGDLLCVHVSMYACS
jgi:hypothetical protein